MHRTQRWTLQDSDQSRTYFGVRISVGVIQINYLGCPLTYDNATWHKLLLWNMD